jgi:hypothetical protein
VSAFIPNNQLLLKSIKKFGLRATAYTIFIVKTRDGPNKSSPNDVCHHHFFPVETAKELLKKGKLLKF